MPSKNVTTPTDQHRDEAHALLKALREPWGCGGGQHSSRCDITFVALQRVAATIRAKGRAEGLREAAFAAEQHANGAGHRTGSAEAICIVEHLEELAKHAAASPSAGQVEGKEPRDSPSADRYHEGLRRAAEIAEQERIHCLREERMVIPETLKQAWRWCSNAAERIRDRIRAELPTDAPPGDKGQQP